MFVLCVCVCLCVRVSALILYKTTIIRMFLGHWVPMCALIALGYVTADETDLAIFLLVVAVGMNSATYLGFQVSLLWIFGFSMARIAEMQAET